MQTATIAKRTIQATNGNEKMDSVVFVQTTYDYEKFSSLDGNRNLNGIHLRRLIESMKLHYLFSPIIVNEKYQIIDGQHRHAACSQLKEPIHYIVKKGYGLRETQILNMNNRVWNCDDFMAGYVDLGYKEYINYKSFKDKYGFSHETCLMLLSGVNHSGGKVKSHYSEFFAGKFKINSIEGAERIANRIISLKEYYEGYKRRSLVGAIFSLSKNKSFVFKEFIDKVKLQPGKLVDCPSVESYVQLIESIYNYRRREKVNLRYSK